MEAEVNRKYNLALARGKSSFNKNDFVSAKAFYEEAINLKPNAPEPANQLSLINKKLEDNKRGNTEIEDNLQNNDNPEDSLTAIETDYYRSIASADSLVNVKAYDSAIIAYRKASVLMPLPSYPWKQIKYVQSEIALNEKRKKVEAERRFTDAITRADKAVTEKKYDDAKSAYTEALTIHPENEYAQKRLQIMIYQLEKARAEK